MTKYKVTDLDEDHVLVKFYSNEDKFEKDMHCCELMIRAYAGKYVYAVNADGSLSQLCKGLKFQGCTLRRRENENLLTLVKRELKKRL